MSKTKSIIGKTKSSKSKNRLEQSMTSPKVLLAGRIAFISERLKTLNTMQPSQVVNKGNGVSSVTLQAGREVYRENVNRKTKLAEQKISASSTIDLNKIFADLSAEEVDNLASLVADNGEIIREEFETSI